ncbi:calcium-activated chloride channel regulator 1-like [Ascaphus truei]|uniref:calcium-activated chloride channel regulator 1-like n=1 Tax=Ascaphus truei TaxID=8439 RepID=UPI003F59D187
MAPCNVLALVLALQVLHTATGSMVKLNNGGYEDIVIAINPGIPEDVRIIENIQNMVKEATNYLFHATKKRLFIRSAKILIPLSWSQSNNYTQSKTETYDKADVIIADPFLKYGEDPYTLQYGGCGEPGRYIHLTPSFLLDDKLASVYGPRGRVLVHEWAHLRWGVFDEYNTETPYYIAGSLKVEATRCSEDIIGTNTMQCPGNSCGKACNFDPKTGLYEEGCVFVPEKNQFAKESIMYMQALSSVSEFCDASTHNTEAPTLQNRMCNYRSTWEVIVNSTDIKSTAPLTNTNIPAPSFSLLQYRDRVVTLVLDVSGSMGDYDRINRMKQAAEIFLIQIIETDSYVGLVKFGSSASPISQLVQIITPANRETLKLLLPTTAGGGTNICAGIRSGFEVNKELYGSSDGTEIVLLTDGEDNYNTALCYSDVIASGAIVHVIALGPNAAKELEQFANITGGLRYVASDTVDANDLIDAFSDISAGNGDNSQTAIQLESTGLNAKPKECLNGTVSIDSTVGNSTFFLVTWQSAVPALRVQTPTGNVYTAAQFTSDPASKSSRLEIPGTAESGAWHYSLCNSLTSNQAIGITVSSKAADKNVPPVMVNAHMNQDTNTYPNPMVVYAAVSQGLLPVTGATVTAIIEPLNGNAETLELLDNGAGADITKNDGIYSKYFTGFSGNGRHNLKVRVESEEKQSRLVLPRSRALYIPGYVENGEITMNPPRPVLNDDDLQLNLGAFSRTASGGSFIVTNVPPGPKPDIYRPEKITDLEAKIEENKIVLSWTATGDDLDQGNASRYDLRMGINPKELRINFETSTSVNISSLTPLPAGSSETFTFVPNNIVIQNGTILYFALIAFDKVSQKSDLSNIAQAALLIPPAPTPTRNDDSEKLSITALALIVCGTVIVMCLIISIAVCIVSCQKKKKTKHPEMRL